MQKKKQNLENTDSPHVKRNEYMKKTHNVEKSNINTGYLCLPCEDHQGKCEDGRRAEIWGGKERKGKKKRRSERGGVKRRGNNTCSISQYFFCTCRRDLVCPTNPSWPEERAKPSLHAWTGSFISLLWRRIDGRFHFEVYHSRTNHFRKKIIVMQDSMIWEEKNSCCRAFFWTVNP